MPRERKKKAANKTAPSMPPHDVDFGMKRVLPPNMMGMHPGPGPGPGGPPGWDPGMPAGGFMPGPQMEFGPPRPGMGGPPPPHMGGPMGPGPGPGPQHGMMPPMDEGMMLGPNQNWRPSYGGPPMQGMPMQGPPMPNHSHSMDILGPGPPMSMGPGPPQGISPGPPPQGISPGPPSMGGMIGIMSKIYPPGQPVVANPANPSAPPIYPCGVCHKEVTENEHAILCESGCNFWFHRICTGLTERAYQLLTTEVYAEWACEDCIRTKTVPLVKFKP